MYRSEQETAQWLDDLAGPAALWQADWRIRAREIVDSARPHELSAVRIALRQGFVLTSGQSRAAGLTAAQTRSAVNTRRWWSPRRSVLAVLPRPAAPVGERQSEFRAARRCAALEATSAALVRRGSVIGYESAAVLRGLPVIEIPAVPLLVTPGPDRGPRHGAVLRHRPLDPARVDRWYGAPVTRIVDTILDIARLDRAGGLVAADAALHEGLVSLEELHAEVDRCAGWPGARTARFVVDFAEPRTESPLESLTRLLLHDCGLPVPEPQFVINDPSSRRWARVDFCWPEQKFILEADGRLKYDRDDRWREKTREGWLRRLGYKVERVVWDDVVRHPAETGAAVAKWLASRSV